MIELFPKVNSEGNMLFFFFSPYIKHIYCLIKNIIYLCFRTRNLFVFCSFDTKDQEQYDNKLQSYFMHIIL